MISWRTLTLAGAVAAALVTPSAAADVCMDGDANESLAKFMDHFDEQILLTMLIEIGGDKTMPAMLIGNKKGDFAIVTLHNGHTCILAIGHGMKPATEPRPAAERPS